MEVGVFSYLLPLIRKLIADVFIANSFRHFQRKEMLGTFTETIIRNRELSAIHKNDLYNSTFEEKGSR